MQCSLLTLCVLWIWLFILTEQTGLSFCEKTANNKWEVSLRDSSVLSQHGIVEISNDGKVWATIYPSQRGWRVGSVVCRQLGLGPPSSSSIVYDEMEREVYFVACSGEENSLSECFVDTSSMYSFYRGLQVECLPVKAEEFDITLVKSYAFLDEGVVLIFVNGQWGPICTPTDNQNLECVTTCKQMGYGDCGYGDVDFHGEILSHPVLENMSCSSTAEDLQDCKFDVLHRKNCTYHEGIYLEVKCERRYTYASDDDSFDYPYPTPSEGPPSSQYRTALYLVTLFIVTIVAVVLYLRRKNSFDPSMSMVSRTSETHAESQQEASLLPSYEAATANGSYPLVGGYPPERRQPTGYSQEPGCTQELPSDPLTQPGPVQVYETGVGSSLLETSHLSQSASGPVGNGEVHGTSSNGEVDNNIPGTDVGTQGSSTSDPELPTYEEAVARCNNEE